MDGIAQSDRDDLDQRVGSLSELYKAAGFSFFLVGGVVRDLFLGTRSGDIDITTDALPEQTTLLLNDWADTVWDQGARFGTIGARRGGVIVEVTTHRSEQYEEASRKPRVKFSKTIEDDLARRDFTINSIAIELPSWQITDPFNGREHLNQGLLRTPLSPEIAFSEDPLRMLRAARFISRYQLAPDREVEDAISEMAPRLAIVSKERINDEMTKFLLIDKPSAGLSLLQRTGLITQIFSTSADFQAIQPDALDLISCDLGMRWAALLWPIMEEAGKTRAVLNQLKVPKTVISQVVGILTATQHLADAIDVQPSAIRRLLHQTRPNTVQAAALLEAYGQAPSDELFVAIRQLEAEEGEEGFIVPLDGFEVAELIEQQGPAVGVMLRRLMEYRLDFGLISKQEAINLVLNWKIKEEG
jgi:poly(A) polymerase